VLESGLSDGNNLGGGAAGVEIPVSYIFLPFCLVFFVRIIAL